VEWIDEREDYGEERSVLLGMTGGQLLYVAYTERGDNIRIISARRATHHEQDIYFRQNAEGRHYGTHQAGWHRRKDSGTARHATQRRGRDRSRLTRPRRAAVDRGRSGPHEARPARQDLAPCAGLDTGGICRTLSYSPWHAPRLGTGAL